MVVSFHPIIKADQNIICAGREPGPEDLAAIKQAEAVILSQGCSEALYRLARSNCAHIFPNIDTRFDYPGKRGQIQLFARLGLDHPPTECFDSVARFYASSYCPAFPAVVKLDWGGQGETVFEVRHSRDLSAVLNRVRTFEASGQYGFLIQDFIPSGRRALRVVVIGTHIESYWRVQPSGDAFGASLAAGAYIDQDSAPVLQREAKKAVHDFCGHSALQLAGFDFIFDDRRLADGIRQPLALEINYFFGRDGLGGSQAYYQILKAQADAWLKSLSAC